MSSPKCKVGDLAFIKKSLRIANVGLIVSVDEYIGNFKKGDVFDYGGLPQAAIDDGHVWRIGSSTKSIHTKDGKSTFGLILDQWLTPIKGDPENFEEESFEEVLEAGLEV